MFRHRYLLKNKGEKSWTFFVPCQYITRFEKGNMFLKKSYKKPQNVAISGIE